LKSLWVATQIISMHLNKGKALAQCPADKTDYAWIRIC